MENVFCVAVEVNGEVVSPGEEVFTTEEFETVVLEEEQVPLGYEEDNCGIHFAMLALTFVFAAYNLYRVFARSKESVLETNTEASIDRI